MFFMVALCHAGVTRNRWGRLRSWRHHFSRGCHPSPVVVGMRSFRVMAAPLELDLDSGVRVRVRPIERGDKDLLRRGLGELGERSRFFRFHAIVNDLSAEQLRYLTEIDYRDHFAWGAAVLLEGEEHPAGVARYVRDPNRPEAAEAAVTVVDAWQGLGIGSLLLEALAETAISNGIAVFTAFVLSENDEMLELFGRLGGSFVRMGEETQLEVPLPFKVAYHDSRLHHILQAMAAESARDANLHRDEGDGRGEVGRPQPDDEPS